MKKYLVLISILFGMDMAVNAQNDADVKRYSSNYFLGTARFNAMGGAFGALGGDLTSTHVNPAGVGVYRFGEISFTPAVEMNSLEGNINGNSFNELETVPVINNIGFVLANEIRSNPDWRSVNFSVSYNRLNTFNDNLTLKDNLLSQNSLIYDFLYEAQGVPLSEISDFSAGLAYDTYIIDTVGDVSTYVPIVPEGVDIAQSQTAERDGRLSETALTVGANYMDKFYFGAGFGFQSVYYNQVVNTTETPESGAATDLVSYTLTERLKTQGMGVNFKLGAIYRVNDYIRIGASAQTPTIFSLSDNYSAEIITTLTNPSDVLTSNSPAGYFEYRLRTPWRFMIGTAAIFGKNAILSAQYERTDFSNGKLMSSSGQDTDFSGPNSTLNQFYEASDIFRAGVEYRFTDSFSARGGFAYFGNPASANESSGAQLDRLEYSAGLGFRKASWYIDAAYRLAMFEEIYKISQVSNLATLENQLSSVALTIGFRL